MILAGIATVAVAVLTWPHANGIYAAFRDRDFKTVAFDGSLIAGLFGLVVWGIWSGR